MAEEKSGFFDAKQVGDAYDRVYNASSFANYFSSFIGNGVFAGKYNDMAVLPANTPDMTVRVLPGQAWINGYWYENANDGDKVFTVQPAAGMYKNRYDAVVVRLDLNERKVSLKLKQGAADKIPEKPSPTRSGGVWELVLAYILVNYGTSSITSDLIADTRSDSVRCGYAHGVIDQVDTTTIFNQLQAQTSKAVSDSQAAVDKAIASLQSAQASAVSAMNSALDGTKVGEQDAKIAGIARVAKHLDDFTTVSNDTDLNNVKTPGSYCISGGMRISNGPNEISPTNFCVSNLFVSKNANGDILQELHCTKKENQLLYCRVFYNNSWSSWNTQYSIGVTPVANGGTGGTSTSEAVSNLGLGTKTLYASGPWLVQAFGKLVIVSLTNGFLNDSSSWASYQCPYVLPNGYRPPRSITAAAITRDGGSWTSRLAVEADGKIYIANIGNAGAAADRSAMLCFIAV